MTTDSIGLYLHVPFCVRKCNYCDFCSFAGIDSDTRKRYIDRLIDEIRAYKKPNKTAVDTIFFGGGTPTLLTPSELERILISVDDTFTVSRDYELTLEGNPGTLTAENIKAYKALGVNRFSLGLQSIHENELKILGRIHNYADFLNSYSRVFSNELIVCSGIPYIKSTLILVIPLS